MRFKNYIFIVIFFTLCSCSGASNLKTQQPKSSTAPQRIISLKPNITEILFALGVGNRVVGVTTWCDYPPEVKALPKVADYISINAEKIIALKPDLVIGSEENSMRTSFESLNETGVKTLFLPFKTIGDLTTSITLIANAVGAEEAGKRLLIQIKNGLALLPTYSSQRKVLILVGHRPLVAAGKGTFYDEVLRLIKTENIVSGKRIAYPTLSTEFILSKNPDVIIDMAMGSDISSELPDILRGRVRQFDIAEFRAGPRLPDAVKKLAMLIK